MPDFETASTNVSENIGMRVEGVRNPDGSLNESYLVSNFGLGVEEASQEVSWFTYHGTVADMLDETGERPCPVGAMLRTAYKEKGVEGVVEKAAELGRMDPNSKLSIAVSPATLLRERLKKKMISESLRSTST